MHKEHLTAALISELENLKKIEIKFLDYKRAGALLRAKIPNFEENELEISFLSRVEKQRGEDGIISSLIDKNGVMQYGTEKVMEVIHDFYSDLYKWEQEDPDIQNYFFRNIESRLSPSEGDNLGSAFDTDFLFDALTDLPNNKSPGEDSLTKEFFEFFWEEISPFYIRCIMEAKNTGELCESQKRGLIKLAHKKNERELLKNYRPISLLNVDLKILTRALAKRLSKVIDKLISQNQTCLPGRQIFLNLHILQDIIDHVNGNNTEAAILFFDAEKAFDRMSHSFLLKTLRHFGCGEDFIEWIQIIYGHCSARVKINGFSTDTFSIKRGIRQGCPLSSLLYVLCAEVLNLEIKRNENIVGLKYNGNEHKNAGYADDLSAIVTKKESIDELFTTLENFGKATNAKVNVEKTEALWVGNWRTNIDRPKSLNWTNSMIKNLGVWVGNDRKEIANISFNEIMDKIKDKLKFWGGKGISLKGKVRVINTFILPKLWYACEIHNIPPTVKNDLKRLLTNFVWDGRIHQRSLQGIEAHYSNGGLQLINIDKRIKAIRVKWLSKVLSSNPNNIEFFLADQLISKNTLSLGLDILKGYTSFYVKTIKHSFYKEACLAWVDSNFSFTPRSMQSIQNLWIYENILLKDDDGRIFKPPNRTRRVANMPYFFKDLPFPILNRRREDSLVIHAINNAFGRITWSEYPNRMFSLESETHVRFLGNLSFKDLYWNLHEKETLEIPWKRKWETIVQISATDWVLVWKNVHDGFLNYKVQSALWMMCNLNFISSSRLSRIFGTSNICLQCNQVEEGPAHCFLFCKVSLLVFLHFNEMLSFFIDHDITLEQKAFGILINDFVCNKKERIVNYLISNIKYIIFKRRANVTPLDVQQKANIRIREIKKHISSDLASKFCIAKSKNKIPIFQNNFLIHDYLGKIENSNFVASRFLT